MESDDLYSFDQTDAYRFRGKQKNQIWNKFTTLFTLDFPGYIDKDGNIVRTCDHIFLYTSTNKKNENKVNRLIIRVLRPDENNMEHESNNGISRQLITAETDKFCATCLKN